MGDASNDAEPAPPTPSPPAASADAAERPLPAASPFAVLRPTPAAVVVTAFDLLTRASGDLRRASFYIGLIVAGTIGPIVLLLWGLEVVAEGQGTETVEGVLSGRAGEWLVVGLWLAVAGVIVAFVESRAVAAALLATRLDGRAMVLRDAVQRSRTVFWRVLVGIAIVNIPVFFAQDFVGGWLGGALGGESEISLVSAAIIVAIAASPFAYVLTGIVLGDVGPVESARRSLTLFSARRATAVVVSLFALAAQLLTLFGASAGLEVVVRAFDVLAIGPASGDIAVALTTVVILAVVFAIGSLLFTVAAISAAPQVVAFVALTHAAPGLDRIADPAPPRRIPGAAGRWAQPRFRWLTIPMRAALGLGLVAAVAGLVSMNR